jgi:CubicO group peptidase (beta-lactamase class C family)
MNRITRRLFALQGGAALCAALAPRSFGRIAPEENGRRALTTRMLSRNFLAGLPRLMELAYVPGLSIAVVEGGRVTWARGFGVKKAETKDAVDAETVFPAASLSKPVFAYGVLRLREEGLLDLDRPLADYLPGAYALEDARAKLITARHVLSHTSGFQNWRFAKDDKLQIAFDPGARFQYSGEGYFYLQRVVEQLTGQSVTRFMRERVLRPLGMEKSSYAWLPEYEKLTVWGHRNRGQASEGFAARAGRKMEEVAARWNKPVEEWKYEDVVRAMPEVDASWNGHPVGLLPNVAGTLNTTAPEFARFMVRVMHRAARDAHDLKEASRREMLTPQVRINDALAWGLGWGLESAAGHNYFWHWGDNGTFHCFAIGDPVKRSGLVVFTNSNFGPKLYQRIINHATGHDHPAFLWI